MKAGVPRKRIILVNRDLQFRYARLGLLVGFTSSILSALVILYPLYKFQILNVPNFLPIEFMGAMAAAVLINMMMITYLGVIITHRIAGPIFALSVEFAEVGQGIFGRELQCRRSDDLKYLIRSFNEMSINLKNITHDDLACINLLIEKTDNLLLSVNKLNESSQSPNQSAEQEKKSQNSSFSFSYKKQLDSLKNLLLEFKSELLSRIHEKPS